MPKGDKTGPAGSGELTGRQMGYCTGHNTPGYMNPCFGRGFGQGFGRGRGFGRRLWTTPQEMIQVNKEPTEKELLSDLKAEREEINKAIKELEQKKK